MTDFHLPGFEILHSLGEGGMGEVYLARRKRDGRRLALKVATRHLLDLDDESAKRLRREAELLSRVESPHLPRYFGLKKVDEHWVIGMQYVEGVTLSSFLDGNPDTFERQSVVRRTLMGVASALLSLHEQGIVHRDVKPANCILTRDRKVVLVDFGLAWGPEVTPLTNTGASIGTPEYMSPELIKGEGVGPKSDVYQLGLVARDLLLGRREVPDGKLVAELMRRCSEEPEDPSKANGWIHEYIGRWIQRALDPDPESRQDAKYLLRSAVDIFGYIEAARTSNTAQNASKIPMFVLKDMNL